jgi:hypothetical protein
MGSSVLIMKLMNFYQRVLSRFATGGRKLKIRVDIEFTEESGISTQELRKPRFRCRNWG